MRKSIVTAGALAACVSTQLFAQNAKEGTITFSLTAQSQTSVSVSKSTANAGNWSDRPLYYKTGTRKLTQADLMKCIAFVLHGNPGFYSSSSKLVLVQGELSGFFSITPEMEEATPIATEPGRFEEPAPVFGMTSSQTYTRLATGRHMEVVPPGYRTSGNYPPGHLQPWGQIFVKDPTKNLCENVSFFFSIMVEECYDCFYLNSFISDSTFTFKTGESSGPPCCDVPVDLLGKGKDSYYMHWSFDNTDENPYLNEGSDLWVGTDYDGNPYVGVVGINAIDSGIPADGVEPDIIQPYIDPIRANLGSFNPYLVRFSLRGIVTYSWNLKFVNKSDIYPEFVGKASYDANGVGFIGLACSLLTGSANISEATPAANTCCLDVPWYNSWFGVGEDVEYDVPINENASASYHWIPVRFVP
jgi:hypothetical protein